jgi:selenium donor protein
VVTGIVDPDKVLTNDKAQPGDAIILTKPIGLGIISTAVKRGMASPELAKKAIQVMSTLNRDAAEAMLEVGAHACTDVTGFGLLGHLKGMARASKVDAVIYAGKVPVIKEAWDLAAAGAIPGGTLSNMDFVSDTVEWDESISRTNRLILCDAQTSGGLIVSIPQGKKDRLLKVLKEKGVVGSTEIGEFAADGEGRIAVKL